MNYVATYRPWLIRIINERIYLSRRGYCPELLTTAIHLKKLVDYNGYRSPEKLAAFILRKKEQIKQIIPSNHALKNQLEKLDSAIELSNTFQDTV